MITYEDFKKIEIRAGKIISAEKIPDTDKLLKLVVDFGEKKVAKEEKKVNDNEATEEVKEKKEEMREVSVPRQIVSGIYQYFPDPSILVGKTCLFVTNLEPRIIRGYESNGMLFALSTKDGGFSILEPNETIPPGTLAG